MWACGLGQPHGRAGGKGIPGTVLVGGSAPRRVSTFISCSSWVHGLAAVTQDRRPCHPSPGRLSPALAQA